jgi:hypothetical protein
MVNKTLTPGFDRKPSAEDAEKRAKVGRAANIKPE